MRREPQGLDILYDKRDPLSRVLLEACERVKVFKNMVDKDAISLPARSPKLFTLTALYDATSELFEGRNSEEHFHGESVEDVVDFWNSVAEVIPEWTMVKDNVIRSIDLRQEKICAHSVVLRAIGAVGNELKRIHAGAWKEKLTGLSEVNWRKDNADWDNVCIVANSVVSNRQARVATRAYLKEKIGLPLTDVEKRSRASASAEALREQAIGDLMKAASLTRDVAEQLYDKGRSQNAREKNAAIA